MKRRRLTELFPFLLPLRKLQRKVLFYLQMRLDSNTYSKRRSEKVLEHKTFTASSKMVNPNSGFDIKYQINKVHNLKLVAKTMDRIVIEPNEVFSFWVLAKNASKHGQYKDGLTVVNDKTIAQNGGGLCQVSNLLFWVFLHTPLTIVERHSHSADTIPFKGEMPPGVDATIAEGWKDLKIKNDTGSRYQIVLEFDEDSIYASIYSDKKLDVTYSIQSENLKYVEEDGLVYRYNQIYRISKDPINDIVIDKKMILNNRTEVRYKIDEALLSRRAI